MTQTIEDIIDKVVSEVATLRPADKTIFFSIARQIRNNIGLTDRQYSLVKEKLLVYKDDFEKLGILNFENSLISLRIPLRIVNRTKSISIVNSADIKPSPKSKKLIEICFPFNKKILLLIHQLSQKHKKEYYHQGSSTSHYFDLNELTIESIVDAFTSKNFEIDQQLVELNQQIKYFKTKKEDHVPGLYNGCLMNFNTTATELIKNEIGDYNNPDNLLKLYDRRRRYGIGHIECSLPENLLGKIVSRPNSTICIDPLQYTLAQIADVIVQLDRFPILVIINETHALEQVKAVHDAFNHYVKDSAQSVLFRVNNTLEYNLNNYIKDKQLNNWVDKTTKIVYIKDKLPKVLARSEWQPVCSLILNSKLTEHVSVYSKDKSDLNIVVESENITSGRKKHNGVM